MTIGAPTLRSTTQSKTCSSACVSLVTDVSILDVACAQRRWAGPRTQWRAVIVGRSAGSPSGLPMWTVSIFQQQLRNVTGVTAAILQTLQHAPGDYYTGRTAQMARRHLPFIQSTALQVLIDLCIMSVHKIFQEIRQSNRNIWCFL